jgi:hypothetical protein
MYRPRRPSLSLLLVALAVGAAGAVSASPAAAQLTCLIGTHSESYAPGLTNTTRLTVGTVAENVSGCLSLTQPAITSGTSSGSFASPNSCNNLLAGGPSTQTFTWNTGQTSTFSFNTLVNIVAGQIVLVSNGTVTAGAFAGETLAKTAVLTTNLSDCSTPAGLPGASGPLTILTV